MIILNTFWYLCLPKTPSATLSTKAGHNTTDIIRDPRSVTGDDLVSRKAWDAPYLGYVCAAVEASHCPAELLVVDEKPRVKPLVCSTGDAVHLETG